MFWNSVLEDASPSHIDVLLQMQTVKLSDILFEEDLLQELKTSNVTLANFLNSPEVIAELVANITQLTEKDCRDKSLYSRVHAAYVSCEILTGGPSEIFAALMNHPESLSKIISCLTSTDYETIIETPKQENEIDETLKQDNETNETPGQDNETTETSKRDDDTTLDSTENTMPKVVPQKATLVSKLIGAIHSLAAANLSCHITQDIESFSKLIKLLVNTIEVSGSFEILSTYIKRTTPSELRYVFCEVLSKLNFVHSLIDVMTLSDIEDKQRNACQLLCDIIVIGRQEASEQTDTGPLAQDMLAELLESNEAVHVILRQMFLENIRNSTAIVCGMKVLQTLLEQKTPSDVQAVAKTIEQIQGEIENHLIKFHELLLNPPKQEPIKTTFGIIQKPLGYMRLEVVNLIRTLISTNSPNIIGKLVELGTMKIIIDLFVDYSWNNLLHTQVEQALCLIIKNYRNDEESNYQLDMQHHSHLSNHNHNNIDTSLGEVIKFEVSPELGIENIKEQINELNTDEKSTIGVENYREESNELNMNEKPQPNENPQQQEDQTTELQQEDKQDKENQKPHHPQDHSQSQQEFVKPEHQTIIATEIPSRALLSQLLNECDLIGRLLLPNSSMTNSNNNGNNISIITRNGEKANFGHIIQMINSIAINRDLDTIRDHLDEMKDKRPELYDRWTTFVNVDVASFKEISLYYDAQSANNNVNHRFGHNHLISTNQHLLTSSNSPHLNSSSSSSDNIKTGDDHFLAYLSFTREAVLPAINVDVLPRLRRSKNAH